MRKTIILFFFMVQFVVSTASAAGNAEYGHAGNTDYFVRFQISAKGCSFMRQLPELTPFKVKCQPDWRKMPQIKIQPLRPHNFEANYNRWINIQKIYRPKRSLYQELIRNRRSLNLA